MYETEIHSGMTLLSHDDKMTIDLDTLSMADDGYCVLGQLYGSFARGLEQMEIDLYTEAAPHGFWIYTIPGSDDPSVCSRYLTLTREWKQALTHYRAQCADKKEQSDV